MKKVKASGVNIPEAQRTTIPVKLRLSPEAAEDLETFATELGLTRSAFVEHMLESHGPLQKRRSYGR